MRKGIYHLVKQIVVLFYYLMCNLCPVKQNRIVFDSSLGKSYSGNPKHIYEYLMANGYDLNWDCIWFYENEKYNIPGMSRQVRYGRQAGRKEETVTITTLQEFDPEQVDMFTEIGRAHV